MVEQIKPIGVLIIVFFIALIIAFFMIGLLLGYVFHHGETQYITTTATSPITYFYTVTKTYTVTNFEKLGILYIYADFNENTNKWIINLMVKNIGSTTAIIDNLFLNGKPASNIEGININPDVTIGLALNPCDTRQITITISKGNKDFIAGMTVEVKLHTTSGHEYYKALVLP